MYQVQAVLNGALGIIGVSFYMHTLLLYMGLAIALATPKMVEDIFLWFRRDPFGVLAIGVRWMLAALVIVIAVFSLRAWPRDLGISGTTWQAWMCILPASSAIFVFSVISVAIAKKLGGTNSKSRMTSPATSRVQALVRKQERQWFNTAQSFLSRPFGVRCLLVGTAAVVEEFLFRAYAIGVGAHLLGGVWVAYGVSSVIFALGHRGWGWLHMLRVLFAAAVLGLLFVHTHSIWVCVVAHALLDSGLLATPKFAAKEFQADTAGPVVNPDRVDFTH